MFSYAPLHSQETYDQEAIFKAYDNGYHQSLRDVFSLLEHESDELVVQRINEGMLLDLQDPTLAKPSRSHWLPYYYRHKDQIQYYPEWKAFLRNDLDIPNLPYAILDSDVDPSAHIAKARSILTSINSKSIKKIILEIESLTLSEIFHSKRILLECLDLIMKSYSCEKMVPPYTAIASKLLTINDQYIHQRLKENLVQKSCSKKVIKSYHDQLNNYKRQSHLYNSLPKDLECYSNSQFISELKEQKFTEALNISSSYFEHKVDLYGKLLASIELGNTVDEDELIYLLIQSESSKALYYIFSRWFIYAKSDHPRALEIMNIARSFINDNIQINTPDGQAFECSNKTTKLLAKKSILAFWIKNYQHYEWNEDVNKFVNTNILKKDRQELIHLYKNLNGENSERALRSYWKLIQSDPILVAEVDKIYSKKLLNYNRNLPSRKYKYLIQLARLVEYCKTNRIDYKIDKTLQPILTELNNASDITQVIKLENIVVDILSLENITAFEIWAIVNSGKEHIQYSSTKISNLFYKKMLDEIITSEHHFNLFLKKSNLFKKFGDHGSSKYYLNKIVDNQSVRLDNLKSLKNKNLDSDILSSIEYIINYKKRKKASIPAIPFQEFLKKPSSLNSEELANIGKAGKSALNKLASGFETEYSDRDQFCLLEWINLYTPKELLPFIVSLKSKSFNLQSAQNIDVPVNEFASQIISTYITRDDSPERNWPKEYNKVFKEIFKTDVNKIINSEEVSIETINDIINSKFFTSDTRAIVIDALSRVKPARNITACQLPSKLSLTEMQGLLPNIKSKNALDYLLKITAVENSDEVMAFLIDYHSEKGITIAGRFFNDLFKKQWFTEYIDSQSTSTELKIKIQWILTNYWENEDGLSSFEEEQTVLNIIKIELAGKSVKERLDLIIASFVDNEVKQQTIRKIIYQLDYESIPLLLDYYDSIKEIGGLDLFKFITEDFGIPIQDISDREAILQLSSDLRALTEEEVYFKYLDKIGVSLINTENEFDIPKAYSIITEDLVRPFVGTGGSVRDIYVFGTIKLLEKKFNKTLGFHPKLNESQSFYKYTSKKRAQAWAEELSSLIHTEL